MVYVLSAQLFFVRAILEDIWRIFFGLTLLVEIPEYGWSVFFGLTLLVEIPEYGWSVFFGLTLPVEIPEYGWSVFFGLSLLVGSVLKDRYAVISRGNFCVGSLNGKTAGEREGNQADRQKVDELHISGLWYREEQSSLILRVA